MVCQSTANESEKRKEKRYEKNERRVKGTLKIENVDHNCGSPDFKTTRKKIVCYYFQAMMIKLLFP